MFKLTELTLKDKEIIDGYLGMRGYNLSAYSFANIYTWRDFFMIKWAKEAGRIFIFFQQQAGMFLYLMPLGEPLKPGQWQELGEFLRQKSSPGFPARIDNVETAEAEKLKHLGFKSEERGNEYIYLRDDLASLRGDRFKSKRASLNRFVKSSEFIYRPYNDSDFERSSILLKNWIMARKDESKGRTYNFMLDDACIYHRRVFKEYNEMGLLGRVVETGSGIGGYTFGFQLNSDTFCVLLEVADLRIKGLAQFMFRQFVRETEGRFINVMDDSGQENIRRVKLSYRPQRLEKVWTVLL